jgi:hypothetical protein
MGLLDFQGLSLCTHSHRCYDTIMYAGNDDYTLNVRNDGGKSQLNINIGTTSVLKATPDKLLLPKGESKQVSHQSSTYSMFSVVRMRLTTCYSFVGLLSS